MFLEERMMENIGYDIFLDAAKYLLPCLVGIISAAVTALMIDAIYVAFITVYQVDVISEHWNEISRFAQDQLGRGATIIPVKGGYKKTDKIMLRIVISKLQYEQLRNFIAEIDNKALILLPLSNIYLYKTIYYESNGTRYNSY